MVFLPSGAGLRYAERATVTARRRSAGMGDAGPARACLVRTGAAGRFNLSNPVALCSSSAPERALVVGYARGVGDVVIVG